MSAFRTCPECGRLLLSDARGSFSGCVCSTAEEAGAMSERVSMAWDGTHGEDVMRGEWKPCRVCGYPANLGPICRDLRCEIEYYEREGEGDD